MGLPRAFFSFFSGIMWWVEYRCIVFKQEIENSIIFFHHLFTIFAYFSNICRFCPFWPFCALPWVAPHHQWPQFVLSCPQGPISLWMTLPMDIIDESRNFSQKRPFFHFWPFWHLGTPLYGQALREEALGNTSMGPRQFLGPNHNLEKTASSIRSPTRVL